MLGRKTAAIAATLLSLLLGALVLGLGVGAPSASAKPDLETVKKKVETLDRAAEVASERYNGARVKHDVSRTKLRALNADLARQRAVVETMRKQVAAMVVDQYQGDELSTTSQVVLSADPDAFLDNLNAVSAYNTQRGQVMREFGTELDRLELRRTAVSAEAKQLAGIEKKMKADKAEIDAKAAKAQDLLDSLQADVRTKLLSGGSYSGPLPGVPSNGRAADAVRFAMAQVGKPYSYGATGLGAYDCSGLTMRAWGAAGVGLPHSSSAQMGSGMRVAESDLEPGDLVFYYSPVSHVGMYIGNGLIVNAENPSTGVRVTGLHSMPYVGAVRPG